MAENPHKDCDTSYTCSAGMIAALYVKTGGVYYGLDGVDPWDETRDARTYAGPHPVVAHPPCKRWSILAPFVESQYGYKRGDDGGCFAAALASVRRWGGVLEHPAYTSAWAHFGLPKPNPDGGWQRGLCGGWTCHVEQIEYGTEARKRTWLYACGVTTLPSLRWGVSDMKPTAVIGGKRDRNDNLRRINRAQSYGTPAQFRDVLLGLARTAGPIEPPGGR